jgi:hypothetical protein
MGDAKRRKLQREAAAAQGLPDPEPLGEQAFARTPRRPPRPTQGQNRPLYRCRRCALAEEHFTAKDNVAEFAHLCEECALLIEPNFLAAHYARVASNG